MAIDKQSTEVLVKSFMTMPLLPIPSLKQPTKTQRGTTVRSLTMILH